VIRLSLRQFRTEGVIGLGVLVVSAVVLAVTGVHLAHVSEAFQSTCKAAADCAPASNPVLNVDKPLQGALPIVVDVAPALIGLFLGAPLVAREFESGTFRLAWTQSVTRRRWVALKFGLVGFGAVVIGGLLTWMVDWWARPLDAATQNRFGLASFGVHGVVPIGYVAFAFALGATAGAVFRRTVPAIGATLAGFAAARLAVTYWVRPHLASPVRESLPLSAGSGPGYGFQAANNVSLDPPLVGVPNGWLYSTTVVDKAGHAPTGQYVAHACPLLGRFSEQLAAAGGRPPATGPGRAQFDSCTTTLSATFHTVLTYQPANRFWPFQWAELGIFLAAALALCGLTYRWLHREDA
jgi:hypothetical protein